MNRIKERAEIYARNNLDPALPMYDELFDCLVRDYIEIAKEQRSIDIDTIPQLYVRWLLIDDEYFDKPTWEEYANKAMEE